ncbi:hypothetical protein [Pseudochelatococcus sp. G4_1912]|uniref:hypothetical protein n=1 Tax=Pseudochelatococcus sp. G4_1912 TaxID=3114288 RepID=UPI0039C711E1
MASALTGAEGATEAVIAPPLLQDEEFFAAPKLQEPGLPSHDELLGIDQLPLKADPRSLAHDIQHAVPISLAITSQIAAAIARPLEALNIDHAPFGLLTLDDARKIAQHPFFVGPLNRAAAHLSGLDKITIDAKHLRRLGHNSASQLSLLLATGDPAHIAESSLLVGAIVLHKHFLARALKAEREMLQRLMGADTYRIATREAPMLHAALAELDDGSFSIPPAFARGDAPAHDMGMAIIATGQRVLHDFVDMNEPSLTPLLAFRQASRSAARDNAPKTTAMTERHGAHIIRLLRRRFEPWSHTIA